MTRYWDRIIRGLGILTVVTFLIVTLTPISNVAGKSFAIAPRVGPSGAIVVLGAGLMHGGSLQDESLRRVVRGIELYKAGLAPVLVLSGPGRYGEPTPTEAEVRLKLAQAMGVPGEAIVKEEAANTTREESVRIARVLLDRGVKRILLVTESLHLRRAKLVFERAGLQVFAVPADDYPRAAVSPGDRLWLAVRIAQETAALAYYRIAGYI